MLKHWEGGRVRERAGAALVGVEGFGWAGEERKWGGRERQKERGRKGGRGRERKGEREAVLRRTREISHGVTGVLLSFSEDC